MSSRSVVPMSRKVGETWGTPLFSVIPSEDEGFACESFAAVEGPCVLSDSGTIQMCGVFVLASRFTSTTLKITHLPSGETTGSPTRLSFIMSSKVKGCLAWATAKDVKAIMANTRAKKRRIGHLLGKRKSVAGLAAPAFLPDGPAGGQPSTPTAET